MTQHLFSSCSDFFTFEMLFHCGETWQRHRCDNLPQQDASWQAYAELAKRILDPLTNLFERPELTFGFCGTGLRRLILAKPQPHIAPKVDQHAAHELNRQGAPICPRGGAAVDLIYPGHSSHALALWIAKRLPFDRLYVYGPERPLHISHGPEQSAQIVWLPEYKERLIPRRITLQQLEVMVNKEASC